MIEKPFSQSSENNKDYILGVLREAFENSDSVLEIGSGIGQHAVYFASNLSYLTWQPSDLDTDLSGIKLWLDEANLPNINNPINLDVNNLPWDIGEYRGVFTANTLHIMGKPEIENLFLGIEQALLSKGILCIYGPFNYDGKYTSESNERFDGWLKKQNSQSGIRDFEWVNSLAEKIGLELIKDHTMPANNRLLEWRME
ncbi:MAG: methylase [Thermodesulfobacteriota bacterium]|nr:MAG: methylase [Thermodesulfobacteriota bacterium]